MITVMLNEAIQILKANAKILVTSTDMFPSHAGDAILSTVLIAYRHSFTLRCMMYFYTDLIHEITSQ